MFLGSLVFAALSFLGIFCFGFFLGTCMKNTDSESVVFDAQEKRDLEELKKLKTIIEKHESEMAQAISKRVLTEGIATKRKSVLDNQNVIHLRTNLKAE